MRTALLCAALAALSCVSAPRGASSARSAAANEAEAAHTAAVFIDARCDALGEATAGGNGFYVNPKTFATAGHLVEGRNPLSLDFAVLGPDGTCRDAQYANWYYEDPGIDLLFLRVYGRHAPGGVRLADTPPAPGTNVRAVSRADPDTPPADDWAGRPHRFETRNAVTVPLPKEAPKLPRDPFISTRPSFRDGDSGSPLFDETGACTGMFLGTAMNPETGDRVGVHLSAWIIAGLLKSCGPCEDDTAPE